MAVNFPGELNVECDDCGDDVDVHATSYAGTPESIGVEPADLPNGWRFENGEYLCSACGKKLDEYEEEEEEEEDDDSSLYDIDDDEDVDDFEDDEE